MGTPRHVPNRRRRTREGPEPACVQTLLSPGWNRRRVKGELTSCRGTVWSAWQKPPVGRKEEEPGCPQGQESGRHVVRGTDRQAPPVLECAHITGKAGENSQNSGEMGGTLRGHDRRLPGVVTHSRPSRATARSRVGMVLEDGSRVAIDWVTGRSHCSAEKATRRLNVPSAYVRAGKCCGRLARA